MIQGGANCIQVHSAFAPRPATTLCTVRALSGGAIVCAFTAHARAKTYLSLEKLRLHSVLCALTALLHRRAEQRSRVACDAIVDAVVAATKALLVLRLHRVEWLMIFVAIFFKVVIECVHCYNWKEASQWP